MFHKRSILIFAASLVGSAMLTAPAFSSAFTRRLHATICFPVDATAVTVAVTGQGGLINQSGSSQGVVCPMPDDSSLLKGSITGFHVHGRDNSNADLVTAKACATNWDGTGGSCGPDVFSGGAGNPSFVDEYQLAPLTTEWADPNNGGDFIYGWVTLPAKQVGQQASSVRGFWVQG